MLTTRNGVPSKMSCKFRNFFVSLSLFLILGIFAACTKSASSKSEYPQSIVALSPASVEILFAIGAGDQVSAVSDLTDFPAQAVELPKVGGFDGKTLSMEKIMSFKPDLVYLTNGMHNFLIQELEANDIAYYVSKGTSIAAVEGEIIDLGKITGHEKEAKILVTEMKQKLASFGDSNDEEKTSVYYEVWNSPYMSVGSTSFINDVITCAGAVNIFADLTEAYPIVSEETIIASDPDVILLTSSSGLTVQSLAERPAWSELKAVKNNKVFVIDDNLYSRPGPRIADAVLDLEELIKKN